MSESPSPSQPSPPVQHQKSQHESQANQEPSNTSYPAPPVNVKSVPFNILTGLYDKLQSEKKPDKRRRALASWFAHWREEVGKDLYPVLRLLLPQKDRERAVYGLKEKNLARSYIKLMGLGMKDKDSIRLLNWKRPTEKDKTAGDFPAVLYDVISPRSSVQEGSFTVDDVNQILDDLSTAMGKQDVQSKLFQRLYNKTTPAEQQWIARIILKDMAISVKENTVFSVFHPDAHDLFNTCSDLKKVAYELWNPSRRLNDEDKSIQLFRTFSPMLCKRPVAGSKIDDIIRDFGGQTFIIEEKLDGERMQLHKRGNEYYYCSRKGKVYTYLYGSHIGVGSLTPYIDKAFDERIHEIILDGEMLVWDPVSERNLPFGTLKSAALDKSKSQLNPRPCFKVFDLLYLNGTCLASKSVKFRKRNLHAYVKEIKGRIEFVAEYEGKTASDVRKRLEEVMNNRGEGLILKHPNAEYVLNGRNKDWVKVKPEYMDNLGETVDVLVVAGNFGSGKRSGGVSTFVCAVLDDRKSAINEEEPKYSTFVRIGSGLTYADYVWIRQKPWKPFDKSNIPSWYQSARRSSEDKGDVYLDPEDSFILKVKAAEITPSDQYHLGFTMRFPRALSIRDDLSFSDCMTASSILESMKTERKRKMENDDTKIKKKKKTVQKVTVMPEYSGSTSRGIEAKSDLFKGLKFMVASDPRSKDGEAVKIEIVKLVKENGGTLVQVAKGLDPILIVYGGTATPYDLKLVMDNDIHDIIRPQWVYDCVDKEERIPLRRRYFFHATSDRQLDPDYVADDDRGEDAEPSNGYNADRGEPPSSVNDTSMSLGTSNEDASANAETEGWFKGMKEPIPLHNASNEVDSETDPDSDYDEAHVEDEESGDADRDSAVTLDEQIEADDIAMGEEREAMEYDREQIFRHLCFYLDTPENARRHGMEVKSKHVDQIEKSFVEIEDAIVRNGGRVVDLGEPMLTHVVLDKRDISRRKALITATSVPKRRNLVLSDFIHACLEEGTLLDEDSFSP